jgi:hypothetical protein
VAKKHVDLLIRAFGAFLERNPSSTASLVIGGTGPQEDTLRELARELNLSDRIVFLGFVPDSELPSWYGACDMFLSADNADYDLTVMAALPHAKKIVVSTQYEIPVGLKSLRRFFFAAPANADAFAETIARALSTPIGSLMSNRSLKGPDELFKRVAFGDSLRCSAGFRPGLADLRQGACALHRPRQYGPAMPGRQRRGALRLSRASRHRTTEIAEDADGAHCHRGPKLLAAPPLRSSASPVFEGVSGALEAQSRPRC